MGINDFLKSGSNIDAATNNIMNIANECKNYGIKNICFMYYSQQSSACVTVNNALKLNYVKYGYIFIENSNIVVPDNLWQDGFHLNDSENSKLLNNLLDFLNNNIF